MFINLCNLMQVYAIYAILCNLFSKNIPKLTLRATLSEVDLGLLQHPRWSTL